MTEVHYSTDSTHASERGRWNSSFSFAFTLEHNSLAWKSCSPLIFYLRIKPRLPSASPFSLSFFFFLQDKFRSSFLSNFAHFLFVSRDWDVVIDQSDSVSPISPLYFIQSEASPYPFPNGWVGSMSFYE